MLLDELLQVLPVVPPGASSNTTGIMSRLPVCKQREHFERFVERAEAAGQADDGVALLHEHQLAREEVLHVHELGVAGDDRVGRLLEGEHDVQAHRVLAARAAMARFHDAAGGAGDDQPSLPRPSPCRVRTACR